VVSGASEERIDRARLARLVEREQREYADGHRESRELFRRAQGSQLAGVPMVWMTGWPGGFPLFVDEARGNRVRDVDGHVYLDFCLGDTGAMGGHSPEPVVAAIRERVDTRGGLTVVSPTEDAIAVCEELGRRFGVPLWQLTLSATDANRNVLRVCRQVQQRPYVLVVSYCYHGTVDETELIITAEGEPAHVVGNPGPAFDPLTTSKVMEFNDLEALGGALAPRDVACVLIEPAMTNMGIVLPEPGYLDGVRRICDETGTLLVIDETHTWSAGPGGCTRAWGLRPDAVTIGKALGSGVPIGAYGLSRELGGRLLDGDLDWTEGGGVGGTLAGNALSSAAARATLESVLTEKAFEHMIALGGRYARGVAGVIEKHGAPWTIVQLGARAEYRFCPAPPRNGGESEAAGDPDLEEYLHLYAVNRSILLTPFHNMALMCPATTEADVDRLLQILDEAVAELFSGAEGPGP
jgi:glutamate-1-semialdehyde 2,1-aminomutase